MREIKFRAWDKESNTYIYNVAVKDSFAFKNNVHLPVKNGDVNYVIQQFTGLLDSEQKEIYEGDKIKIFSFYNQSGSSEDWFGTEPQNSYRVYEEYLEQIEAKIVFLNGGFVARTNKEDIPLQVVLYGLGKEISEYYQFDYGGPVEYIMENLCDYLPEEETEPIYELKEKKEPEIDDIDFWEKLEVLIDKVTSKIELIPNAS